MKIGILDCDDLAPELLDDFNSYAVMFRQLLDKTDDRGRAIDYKFYKACHGEFPQNVDECDAYLISGSKTGVYDQTSWREPIRNLVQEIYDAKIRMVGICFGHQLLADVLGGRAEKSEKGWGIGAITHTRVGGEDYLGDMPQELTLLFSHQDQVTKLPPNALRVYGSDFCENGAFIIPDRVLAFQGHPEFTKEYSERLMRLRKERYTQARFEQGIESLALQTNELSVAQWMKDFLCDR